MLLARVSYKGELTGQGGVRPHVSHQPDFFAPTAFLREEAAMSLCPFSFSQTVLSQKELRHSRARLASPSLLCWLGPAPLACPRVPSAPTPAPGMWQLGPPRP